MRCGQLRIFNLFLRHNIKPLSYLKTFLHHRWLSGWHHPVDRAACPASSLFRYDGGSPGSCGVFRRRLNASPASDGGQPRRSLHRPPQSAAWPRRHSQPPPLRPSRGLWRTEGSTLGRRTTTRERAQPGSADATPRGCASAAPPPASAGAAIRVGVLPLSSAMKSPRATPSATASTVSTSASRRDNRASRSATAVSSFSKASASAFSRSSCSARQWRVFA